MLRVVLAQPRGFCAGVERAIETVERAVDVFGPDRLMFASDWPVCLMAGDYERVWTETMRVLEGTSTPARDAVLGRTAAAVYGLTL